MEDEFVRHDGRAVCDDFVWRKIPPDQISVAGSKNSGICDSDYVVSLKVQSS